MPSQSRPPARKPVPSPSPPACSTASTATNSRASSPARWAHLKNRDVQIPFDPRCRHARLHRHPLRNCTSLPVVRRPWPPAVPIPAAARTAPTSFRSSSWSVSLLFAILGPVIAQLLYFACSRKREYLADASGAQFTRYPEGLASALEKISQAHIPLSFASKATAPMFIINPAERLPPANPIASSPPTHRPVNASRYCAR